MNDLVESAGIGGGWSRERPTLRVLAGVALALSAVLTSCSSDDGAEQRPASTAAGASVSGAAASATGATGPATAPDLVGKQITDARTDLTVLGVRVIENPVPSLRAPGTVTDQIPGAGLPLGSEITLSVATELPPMPNVVGDRQGEAESMFKAWGLAVRVEPEFSLDVVDGEVVSTTPAVGQVIGSEVVLHVGVAPVVARIGPDVEVVGTGDYSGFDQSDDQSVEMNGELYENALLASAGYADPGEQALWDINLGRDWKVFTAVIGLTDDSDSEAKGRFRVYLDGKRIAKYDVAFGHQKKVKLDITGGLRLRLETVETKDVGQVGLVFADPTLLGVPGTAPDPAAADTEGTDEDPGSDEDSVD